MNEKLVGSVFNQLTILRIYKPPKTDKYIAPQADCICSCGQEKTIRLYAVTASLSKSCGCLIKKAISKAKKTHGLSHTHEYGVWTGIMSRCYNERNKSYHSYGGRGISVCKRWHNVKNFISDMGKRPTPKHSIDRINNNGNYKPSNCRWATFTEQSFNKCNTLFLTYNGETKTMKEWAKITGFPYGRIRERVLLYGWSVEKALTTEALKARRKQKQQ